MYERSAGKYTGNDVYSNSPAGFEVEDLSKPTISDNQIHHNAGRGLLVQNKGLGTLSNNHIFENDIAGIHMRTEANMLCNGNDFCNSKDTAVLVTDGAFGMFELNRIYSNTNTGVTIQSNANPTLRYNDIMDNGTKSLKGAGIRVEKNGEGNLRYNDIFDNHNYGVEVKGNANPYLKLNSIHESMGDGNAVHISGGATGQFEQSQIYNDSFNGMRVSADSSPRLFGNRFTHAGNPHPNPDPNPNPNYDVVTEPKYCQAPFPPHLAHHPADTAVRRAAAIKKHGPGTVPKFTRDY